MSTPGGPAARAWAGCAVVVAAGGRARRMGGADKLAADLGGAPLLQRLLDGVPAGVPVCLVGPPRPVARPVLLAREDPPHGGPAAAVAAGVRALHGAGGLADVHTVVVLAGDAPWAPAAVPSLLAALAGSGPGAAVDAAVDGAVAVDGAGRRQVLLAAHRTAALLARLEREGSFAGRPAGALLDGALVAEVLVDDALAADVDTPGDLAQAAAHLQARSAAPGRPRG